MPTTLLDNETYADALARRMQEEATFNSRAAYDFKDDGLWPCAKLFSCKNRVAADCELCPECEADRLYYEKDEAEDWE